MIRVFAIVVAIVMAMSLGISGAMAQAKLDKPSAQKTDKMDQATDKALDKATDKVTDKAPQKIEAKIKSVSPGGMVTLEDGTKLAIPKSLMIPKGQLKPGASIEAEYQKKGSQKVATSVQIKG